MLTYTVLYVYVNSTYTIHVIFSASIFFSTVHEQSLHSAPQSKKEENREEESHTIKLDNNLKA